MGDPSDRHAVDEITFFTGNYVVRAVATQMQIAWCLAHYYGHVTELGQRLLQPKDDGADADEDDDGDEDAAPAAASPAAAAAAPAVPLPTRARGDTARVQAARHRVLPPVTVPPPLPRPSVDVLDRSTPAPPGSPPDTRTTVPDLEAARIAAGPPPPEPAPLPVRSRTASGEIPIRSVPSAPRSADTETSDPEITITGSVEETTSPGTRAPRTRVPDPPELAERGGEIAGRDAGARTVTDEPRVVIDLDALKPSREAPILRSGEIRLPRDRPTSIPPVVTDEPSVKVTLEPDEPPAVIHDTRHGMDAVVVEDASDVESAPILLERLRTVPPAPAPAAAPPPPADDDTDVVLLQPRRPRTTSEKRRLARHTQLGMGRAGTGDERARRDTGVDRASRDTEVGGLPPGADMMMSQIIMIAPDAGTTTEEPATTQVTVTSSDADDAIVITAAAPDETIVTTAAPVHVPDPDATADGAADDDDDDEVAEPPRAVSEDTVTTTRAAPAPASTSADDTDDDGRTTDVHAAIPEPSPRPGSRRTAPALAIDHDAVDDGWGPPGTTIPPPFVGAAIDDSQPLARIPISDADSAPIVVAPPVTRGSSPADAAAAARDLDAAATRLVTVLRDIDTAKTRDEVIYNLINHLGETHNRAAFLAVKNGELIVFSVRAPSVAQPRLTLSLDLASTFQDVVGTRLPYRGPVIDDPTRHYLQGLLGTAPAEMLVIPVAVRDRVVGVLYADGRRRQTFDDHYTIAARAAGLALERILSAAKRTTDPPTAR
jgi:hypothetical protein